MPDPRSRRASRLVRLGGGQLAHLPRRALLTLRYLGWRTVVWRIVTFPLRLTPLGTRIKGDALAANEHRAAARWYRREGRPVTIVIPTYGDPAVTLDAVRSVRRTTDAARARLLVVDDGSDAVHVARLREALAPAELILGERQAGFAANANRGLTAATGDVVLLNSDVIAHKGWLERLQYYAYRSRRLGIAGPKLLYPDRRIQSAGTHRNPGAPEWFDHRYRFKPEDDGPANVPAPVLAVCAAAMYLKREALDDIGLLDERYPMAYEDVDLCLRAWEAGWTVGYYPHSVLTHLESAVRGTEVGARELLSQERFWERWEPFFGEREVRTPEGRLRVVYVTEDTGVGGGHRDIFEHLNRLAARGHDVALWSLGGQPTWFDLHVEVRTFQDYEALRVALAPLEAIKVATWWNTASTVWAASVCKGVPAYFVQDIETSYYPESAAMRNAVLASYRPEFRYMTISGWNRDRLRELGVEPAMVPPGLDLETFRVLPGERRRDDVLLAIGRTNPLKNLPLTIEAWQALGPPVPELWMFGVEPQVGEAVGARYVREPSDEGVNELFNEATAFVQTSRHEGFCLPPLEAMAAGCAVVCTDAHGNRDFCRDGENCLMPEPDAASVTAALRRVLGDAALRERLVAEGLRTAAPYAWERRIDELETFFASVAGSPGGVPTGPRPPAAPRG